MRPPVGGDALREYLDWRPYEYFTSRLTLLPPKPISPVPWIETFSFDDLGDGRTKFRWTVRRIDRSDESLAMFKSMKTAIGAREAKFEHPRPRR